MSNSQISSKLKRLNKVLDRLTSHVARSTIPDPIPVIKTEDTNNNGHGSSASFKREDPCAKCTTQEAPLDLSVKNEILTIPAVPTILSIPETPLFDIQFRARGLAAEQPAPEVITRFNPTPDLLKGHCEDAGGPHPCKICGESFLRRDRLAKHVASRHRDQTRSHAKERGYICNICFRGFSRSDMLTRHARLHTGDKPYCCSVCNQVFSRSDHLSTHRRTHTGEKPYRCSFCPYEACRRDMVTRHMKTHLLKNSMR